MAVGDFPNWAVAAMSGGFALAGSVVGGLIAFAAQTHIAKSNRNEDRRATAAAIAGEIEANIDIIRIREFIPRAEAFIKELSQGNHVLVRGFATVDDTELVERFPILNGTLPKIGLLGPLAGDVVRHYIIISAIEATGTQLERGKFDEMEPSYYAQFLKEELDLLQSQMEAGKLLVEQLRRL